ncbi:MAG: hypothetical protein JW973_00170 [Bacteroidales bacterium]|nr:hypothetical protein [Bacteroidales bacterium]
MKIRNCVLLLVLLFMIPAFAQKPGDAGTKTRSVHLDKKGVIRWENNEEVALFGANYCLPAAGDYRAAGYISDDRKKMIDQDMAHFARMSWDGLRVCLWGDYENSDKEGNLVENDHLDLMDYLIYKAKERGIYMLFTPIHTYNSQWPDALEDTISARGFSTFYKKSELGTNPEAIRAQVNYLKQILNHVNPYTGIAIKDEPSILFIEMINEPDHHSNDFAGSVSYINTLVDAVRSTGCKKILFHNVTQDMKMARAIKASKADGITFGWYPMGLVSGHRLQGNHLRAVDDYTTMHTTELKSMPRIVYEFDEADSYTPYMYPAMVRSFRGVGAQFASMFSYDMLATAPYNLGWQTHLMNMVYYPQKAVAAVIAAAVMKKIPLYQQYGRYPQNTTFGPFRVDYEQNLSKMVSTEQFYYSNTTTTQPPDAGRLKKIVGYGSSPVIHYPGKGIYFMDKVKDGVWRLEVYPDALLTEDPFEQPNRNKIVSRLIARRWPMTVDLPDLGRTFDVLPVNKGNSWTTRAKNGKFDIQPGVYVLSSDENLAMSTLPEKIGSIGFNEFVCPAPMELPLSVNCIAQAVYNEGDSIAIRIEVIDNQTPQDVSLYYRSIRYRNWYHKVPMKCLDGYIYETVIPADKIQTGIYNYCVTVTSGHSTLTFPGAVKEGPRNWDFYMPESWKFSVVDKKAALCLLDPLKDIEYLSFTRIGDGWRQGVYDVLPAADRGKTALRLYLPFTIDKTLDDYTMSVPIKDKILARRNNLEHAKGIVLRTRGDLKGQSAFITLMEADGTSWSASFEVTGEWQEQYIPLENLKAGNGVLLPLGFPERWNYWVRPAGDRGGPDDHIKTDRVERIQVSVRPSGTLIPKENPWLDVSTITINFE